MIILVVEFYFLVFPIFASNLITLSIVSGRVSNGNVMEAFFVENVLKCK